MPIPTANSPVAREVKVQTLRASVGHFAGDVDCQNMSVRGRARLTAPWQDVASTVGFANGWTNYGGGYYNAAFCRDALGFVHLRGLIKSGATGNFAFTLPVGYRPAANVRYAVNDAGTGGIVVVVPGGGVQANSNNNALFQLDGLTFYAEQ